MSKPDMRQAVGLEGGVSTYGGISGAEVKSRTGRRLGGWGNGEQR